MRLTRALLWLAAIALAATGVAYVIVPEIALDLVDIDTSPTTAFLLRTEGVALVTAAAFLLLIPQTRSWRTRSALLAVAAYLIVGSVIDVRASLDGIVGPASLVSAAVRIAAGALCVLAAITRTRVAEPSSAPPAIDTEAAPADG